MLKIRHLIQKHFLTGFPHSLRKSALDLLFFVKLAALGYALDHCFQQNRTLAHVYGRIHFNLFNEEYLMKMPSNIERRGPKAGQKALPGDKHTLLQAPKDLSLMF